MPRTPSPAWSSIQPSISACISLAWNAQRRARLMRVLASPPAMSALPSPEARGFAALVLAVLRDFERAGEASRAAGKVRRLQRIRREELALAFELCGDRWTGRWPGTARNSRALGAVGDVQGDLAKVTQSIASPIRSPIDAEDLERFRSHSRARSASSSCSRTVPSIEAWTRIDRVPILRRSSRPGLEHRSRLGIIALVVRQHGRRRAHARARCPVHAEARARHGCTRPSVEYPRRKRNPSATSNFTAMMVRSAAKRRRNRGAHVVVPSSNRRVQPGWSGPFNPSSALATEQIVVAVALRVLRPARRASQGPRARTRGAFSSIRCRDSPSVSRTMTKRLVDER